MINLFLKEELLPIPIHVQPLPWEDIASLISRVAVQMGYISPLWVLSPEQYEYAVSGHSLTTLRKAADYQFLGHLLLIDEEALYASTRHSFATSFQKEEAASMREAGDIERPLLKRHRVIMAQFFHTSYETQVCPQCLSEEEVYGRIFWQVRSVVACLRHNIMLQNNCPHCRAFIPLLRPSLVHCPCCKGDYRTARSVPIYGNAYLLAGQKYILSRLGIQNALREEDLNLFTHSPLCEVLPCHYFALLEAFRNILVPFFPDDSLLQVSPDLRPYLHRFSSANSTWTQLEYAVLIATFHFIFTSWPTNFFAFLDALSLIKGQQSGRTGVRHDFGVFYDRWLYRRLADPAFSFMREGFEKYLQRYYTRANVSRKLYPFRNMTLEPLGERPYLTLQQASHMLGTTKENVNALIADGKIVVEKTSTGKDGRRYHCLVLRKSVEAVRDIWKTLLPLQKVAKDLLGISPARVLTLSDAGLLAPVRGPKIDGYVLWMYKDADVEEFIARVVNCASPCTLISDEDLPLSQAIQHLGNGITTARVLAEVLSGRLKPIDTGKQCPLLHRLRLSCQEIARFLDCLHKQRRESLGFLTTRETAGQLHTTKQVVQSIAKAGLLEHEQVRHGKRVLYFFRQNAIEAFRTTYTFSSTAATILHVSSRRIRLLEAEGVLSPVYREVKPGCRYTLFLREDIDALLSTA
jgi:hypothetical protein